jgi:hypothetical protein
LPVNRIGEADSPHLVKHAPNAFAELLANSQIGADSCYPRISSKPSYSKRLVRVRDAWKSSRAFNLNAIRKYFDPYVISAETVRSMNHRVDKSLQPGVTRDDRDRFEESTTCKRPTARNDFFDLFLRTFDNIRYWTFDPKIHLFVQRLTRTATSHVPEITKNSDVRLRKQDPRLVAEQQESCIRHFLVERQKASGGKYATGFDAGADLLRICSDQIRVQISERHTRGW